MDKLVRYLCIIQARINSSRLPGKVMLDLAGKTLLERVYDSVVQSKKIDKVIVATSNQYQDDIIEKKLKSLKIKCFRGDLNNVLKRFFNTAESIEAENIVRITADNPMMDHRVIDNLIYHYESEECDYSSFSKAVYGLSAEVFSVNVLNMAYKESENEYDQEHVTPYIKRNCKVNIVDIEKKYQKPDFRATIDSLEDYIKLQNFYLYCEKNSVVADIDTFLLISNDLL
jgi:spore coat polysaccharide biosynthesis protein SpsF